MKILNVEQINALDQYTIDKEPIASIDLMERASRIFAEWFVKKFPDNNKSIHIFCGPGNNGGDGLAIARLLSEKHYEVKAYILEIGVLSPDCEVNLKKLLKKSCCPLVRLSSETMLSSLDSRSIVIDAIFGSGLNRPLENFVATLVRHLNEQPVIRVSVDIPSGLFADRPSIGESIHADYTFTFELPKLGFLFPENDHRVGEWSCGSIGLHNDFIANCETPYFYLNESVITPLLKARKKYGHKGTYGHALLVSGSYGKVGAAVLAGRAALRSGVGLLTIYSSGCAYNILQSSVPEAMVEMDDNNAIISNIDLDCSQYAGIGIGPGIGTHSLTGEALTKILKANRKPLVLDADAINLIARDKKMLDLIPPNSILTPHPKEFERLFGKTKNDFERNYLQCQRAQKHGIFIVLKGAHTAIASPNGTCHFNSTGNPGMATAGSGDVLTGMITGLLTQGYSPFEAAILGVYLHGLAGDIAANIMSEEAMLAGDIIDSIGSAFRELSIIFPAGS